MSLEMKDLISMIRVRQMLAFLLLFAGICGAQNTGSIGGTVTDSAGAAAPQVAVTLINAGTTERRDQSSNAEGYFAFNNLLPGVYSLRFAAPGFADVVIQPVELTVGQSRRLSAQLELATVQTSVQVTADVAPIVTSNASLSEVVDERRIEDLPLNGRNALQMVNLVPGVVTTGTSGQYGAVQTIFNVSGGRDVDQTFTLDGGIHVNPFYANAVEYPNPDALEEFSVNSRNYSAAYGRGTTSVNAVTKSGTNQFHGDVFEFFRNTDLDARSFFGLTRSPFQRNQYGGVFGGPIRKDRLFFFVAYQGTNQVGSVPRSRGGHLVPAPARLPVKIKGQQVGMINGAGALQSNRGHDEQSVVLRTDAIDPRGFLRTVHSRGARLPESR